MVDVSALHDDELIRLGKVHSSELSDGYLQHLDQKLTPPPAPEVTKVETPKPVAPPVVNVSVPPDPAVGQALTELSASMQKQSVWDFQIERDGNGDISRFIAVEL